MQTLIPGQSGSSVPVAKATPVATPPGTRSPLYDRLRSTAHALSAVLRKFTDNWQLSVFGFSILTAVIARLFFGVALFQPLEELAHRQESYRVEDEQRHFRDSMVVRHLTLAELFLNVSQFAAARAELENALKLDPLNIDAHFGLAKADLFTTMVTEYEPELVERRIHMLLATRPGDPHLQVATGNLYLGMGFRDSARLWFHQALRNDTSVASAYYGLAMAFDLDAIPDSAYLFYEKAWRVSPRNQTYLNNMAYQQYLHREYGAAIRNYELLLRMDSRYLLSWYTMAASRRMLGQLAYAQFYLDRLEELLIDSTVTGLERNRGDWFFHTDSGTIYVNALSERQLYAHYSAALGAYLMGNLAKANFHITRANALQVSDRREIQRLMRFDCRMLQSAQPQWRSAISRFQEAVLP